MSLIAAVYARKSTDQSDRSDEAKSVARQITHARAYASSKDWILPDDFVFVDDGISGAEFARRPGFLRLMNALRSQPPFHVLIMSEESRLGREVIETSYALKRLITAGVRVFYYLEDRERKLESPTDKLLLSVTAFADELERDRARQRTHDALLRKAQSGLVTGGRVFGYANVRGPDGVRRVIQPDEAAVVERIFTLTAQGAGMKAIGKSLNDERAPSPRAQQGRPDGWSPSSIREVLYRPLYRGEIVWNQTRKRDSWGVVRQGPKPETDWIRIPAPELAIIPEALWQAAHRQIAAQRARYQSLSPRGGPAWSRASKYLLTGLLRCAVCGSGMEARSGSHGRRRVVHYGCAAYHRKGTSVCANGLRVRMEHADGAILSVLEKTLLHPVVIETAVRKAVTRLTSAADEGISVATDLRNLDAELARLAEAVAHGGDVPALLAAVRDRESRRQGLLARRAPQQRPRVPSVDAVVADLQGRLADWRSLVHEQPAQARGVVKQLIVGRLDMTPHRDESFYSFKGTGTIEPLIAGVVPHSVASPPGFEPGFQP